MPEVDLAEFEEPSESDRLRGALELAKADRDRAFRQMARMQDRLDLLSALDASTSTAPPTWLTSSRSGKAHRGIANLVLSDLHLDERVSARAVSGVNSYDRKIALARLKRCMDKFCTVAKSHLSGLSYDGATLWLNGDVFSGNIHEELRETNETPIMASFDYWLDPLVAALRQAKAEFGRVHVVGRVGNHGRNTRKPVNKSRVEDNFDWLFYRVLQREFRGDDKVSWDLPLSSDGTVTQYGTRFLATHGDQFHGGSGISGILTPLSLGDHRKSRRQSAVGEPYDYMVIGHFHQLMFLPRIIVNGSLKGYDEFAFHANFGFEPPQQAFWVTTPENGVTFTAAIRPGDRAREGW